MGIGEKKVNKIQFLLLRNTHTVRWYKPYTPEKEGQSRVSFICVIAFTCCNVVCSIVFCVPQHWEFLHVRGYIWYLQALAQWQTNNWCPKNKKMNVMWWNTPEWLNTCARASAFKRASKWHGSNLTQVWWIGSDFLEEETVCFERHEWDGWWWKTGESWATSCW